MKLLSYVQNGESYLGIRTQDGVLNVALAAQQCKAADIPTTMDAFVAEGPAAIAKLTALVDQASASGDSSLWLREEDLQFGPCVTSPGKIICVGLNYRKHAHETNMAIPEYPILFNKFNNTLTGHLADVVLPAASTKVDYEAELAIVIGATTKNVAKEDALDHVLGYCAANDLSARDLQLRTSQWLLGKTCDGFAPLGPYLVTADEVGDPNSLAIKTTVNGEQRQNSNTSDMIFYCDEIISYISQHFTLSPGDVILTGTPEGVVMGYPPEKQEYLKAGDIVTIEIEKLGAITNRLVTP